MKRQRPRTKRSSLAQIKKSQTYLDVVKKELSLALYESLELLKEIEQLKTHHVYCVNSFKNLESYLRDMLQVKDFRYVMTVNFFCEMDVYYTLLRPMPQRLDRLSKKVLRAYIKLHGEPTSNLLKEF
jgi:hypothetical protein